MNDLETQKASFETEYCIQGVFRGSCCWLQLQPLDQKAYLTPDLRQAKKVSPVFPVSTYQEKVRITNHNNDNNDNPFRKR